MTFKTLALAVAATVAFASAASANAFSFNGMDLMGSTAELGQISTTGPATVSIYDYHRGVQGALLGTEELSAGANYDVRIPLGVRPINDVVAVLMVDGQIVETQEIDLRR